MRCYKWHLRSFLCFIFVAHAFAMLSIIAMDSKNSIKSYRDYWIEEKEFDDVSAGVEKCISLIMPNKKLIRCALALTKFRAANLKKNMKELPLVKDIQQKEDLKDMADYAPHTVRPQKVQRAVNKAFKKNRDNTGSWLYNGKKEYWLFDIKDELWIQYLLRLNKENVFIMDIGCANGEWGRNIEKILQTRYKNNNTKFHIFSITGSQECPEVRCESDNVILYQLNQFKIENIDEELANRGFKLEGKIDFVVSRWTLRHLVDPFGTVKKIYDLLVPKTGKFLSNGFLFKFNSSEKKVESFPMRGSEYLFAQSNATILFRSYTGGGDCGEFLIERNDEGSLKLPLQYMKTVENLEKKYPNLSFQCESDRVTVFEPVLKNIVTSKQKILNKEKKIYCFENDTRAEKLYQDLNDQGFFNT